MPQISSYPIISVPGLEDLLIGTDINNLDETKNFRVGDVISILGYDYIPYTGATKAIDIGTNSISANSFIKKNGTSSQFLKADGSSDNTQYTPQSRTITINGVSYDLSSNRSWNINPITGLTSQGSSGPATYVEGILNIPQYQQSGNYITDISGEASGAGPGSAVVTISNSAVISKVLTGFNAVSGSISASDSILTAFGKAQSQINTLISGVSFRGSWNASTNSPSLSSSVGTNGHYYIVSVAGSTNLNGITTWNIGDWLVFNGSLSVWQRIASSQLVSSVNGYTGVVSLSSSDVGAVPVSRNISINGVSLDLSSNRSWTVGDVRSDQSYGNPSWLTSIDWSKISGRPTTVAGYGILNAALSTYTITINGVSQDLSQNRTWSVGSITSIQTTGPITGGTITSSGSIGITQAGPTSNGYLSSSDWNLFNNKVSSINATSPLSFSSGILSISQAGSSSNGYLSSSDWNAFNNKQDAITNPVTGTGTSGYIPIFSGTGSISNSIISYISNSVLVSYNSTVGNSFTLENTGIGSYSYSILMNNNAVNKITTHSYSEGIISESIGGNQVRRVLANGNTILGVSTVDNGNKLSVYGTIFSSNIPKATSNTDLFLVSDSGVIKYRTGSELFSDIGSNRTITINGLAQNLSSNVSWSVGTVTSVSISTPTGLTATGGPIVSSGTISLAFTSGYSIPTTASQSLWSLSYNNSIVSASVTGTSTKTLTLNQQGGGTIVASWVESGGSTSNSITFNNSGLGDASGSSFNGSVSRIISYNTIGAQPLSSVLSGISSLSYVSGTPFVKMTGAGTFTLDTSIYLTGNQTITISGDVSGSGTTSIATTIGNNKVLNSMLAQVPTATFHGRVTAGTGNIENITGTQATSLLDIFTSTLKGLVPSSGGGSTTFLRADATFAAPFTLTTTGSSGAPTFSSGTLNIPTYTLSGLGGVSGSGTSGQVSFFNGSSSLSSDAGFLWDNTNKRLGLNGVGTNNSFIDFQNAGTTRWRVGNNYNSNTQVFQISNTVTAKNNIAVLPTNKILVNSDTLSAVDSVSDIEFTKVGGSTGYQMYLFNYNTGAVRSPAIWFGYTRGTSQGSFSSSLDTDVVGTIQFLGSNNTYFTDAGSISLTQVGSAGSGLTPSLMRIYANSSTVSGNAYIDINGASGQVVIATSFNPRVTVNSSGNVGIGTTSPSRLLHVNGDVLAQNVGLASNTGWYYLDNYGGSNFFGLNGGTALQFYINAAERMRITSGGNIGINLSGGVTNNAYGITSNGDATTNTGGMVIRRAGTDVMYIGNIAVNNTTDFEFFNPRNGYIRFGTNNTEQVRITSAGNLLINTSTDNGVDRIQVNGSARATSFKSESGTISLPTSANTTFYTFSQRGLYFVKLYLAGGNQSSVWSATAIVSFDATDVLTISNVVSTNVSIIVSGATLQGRNIGSTFTFNYDILRMNTD